MLLKKIEYLLEENRILRKQIEKRPKLTDAERMTLAEKAVALGRLMADTVTIVKPLKLPARSPNLNAFAERWVRSIKEECLNNLILFGAKSLRHVLKEYIKYYHTERNHQGIENKIPFADERLSSSSEKIKKSERLGGLLNFYYRQVS